MGENRRQRKSPPIPGHVSSGCVYGQNRQEDPTLCRESRQSRRIRYHPQGVHAVDRFATSGQFVNARDGEAAIMALLGGVGIGVDARRVVFLVPYWNISVQGSTFHGAWWGSIDKHLGRYPLNLAR